MIQAQELRIGNWVQNVLGDLMQVMQLGHEDNNNYIYAENNNGVGCNGFEGIPLSPEILEKCEGVKTGMYVSQDGEVKMWIFGSITLEQPIKSGNVFNFIADDSHEIKYLHQLQNLNYALTGQELEFKP